MDREQYERDLKKRQQKHMDRVINKTSRNWSPCMHDQCTSCHGTGVRVDGSRCIHGIACNCPKCAIMC